MFGTKKSFQDPVEYIIAKTVLKALQNDGLQQLTLKNNEIKIYGDFELSNANAKAVLTLIAPLIRKGISNSQVKFREYSIDSLPMHYIAYYIADAIMKTLLAYTIADTAACSAINKERDVLFLPHYQSELLNKLSISLTHTTKPSDEHALMVQQSEKGLAALIQNTVKGMKITEITEDGIEYTKIRIKLEMENQLKIAGILA